MEKLNRREFIATALGTAGLLGAGVLVNKEFAPSSDAATAGLSIDRSIKRATDKVTLGKSGVKVSLVGIGTGTAGWNRQSNQTRLGQDAFNRLISHALDNGITFFDLADQYGSNPYFRKAVAGVARDRYVAQTKTNSRDPEMASQDIDRFLRELNIDYIDSLIIHCVTEPDWTTRYRGVMDALEEAKQKGKIRAHGVTCHSFEALKAAEASDWVDINQVRWNPAGAHMDADVETARKLFSKMRAKGQGMIGMKVVGQGDIVNGKKTASPKDCFRFQIESGVVDAFVLGVETPSHIDEMIRGTEIALSEVGYRAVQLG
jgi:1-deoxyxylulose-5-phosphate synthase